MAKTSNTKRNFALVLMVLAAAVAGAGATYYLGSNYLNAHAAVRTAAPAPAETPIFVALEPFTVNLRPDDRNRFLHIGITLKVADAKAQAQITEYLPEARSRILTLLSNRDSASLVSSEDKSKLADEIRAALNQPSAANQISQHVNNVLFTAFVVQ